MITLQNKRVTAQIDALGAQLCRLCVDGKDLLWCGDPAVFGQVAPVLFPYCGRLKNGQYRHEGKAYELPIHGFASQMMFEIKQQDDSHAVFVLRDSAQTIKMYPFSFRLEITYTLLEDGVDITFAVTNTSSQTLPFSLGGHYGFAAPYGVPGCTIRFDRPLSLYHHRLTEAGLLAQGEKTVLENRDCLMPDYSICENDTYVFLHQDSRACVFSNQAGSRVRLEYPDSPNLLLWTLPGAKFICIEPWNGRPDTATGQPPELAQKQDVMQTPAGESRRIRHRIRYLEEE